MENMEGKNKNGQEPEKKFTQEEVNRIVQDRVAREKATVDEREKELEARELKLNAKELCQQKNIPADLIDGIDLTSKDTMTSSIDRLEQVYQKGKDSIKQNYSPAGGMTKQPDPIREAMGLPHR